MAAGLPVVSTRFGGPSESMVDESGQYGILIDPNDPDELAAGLLRLLTNEKEWERFQRAGHQRVLDRYTWERTAEGYAAVCQGLAGEPIRSDSLRIPEFFLHPDEHSEPMANAVIGAIPR
jgi:sucrose-phosphate synthase